MKYQQIASNIIDKYNDKYYIYPTVNIQSFSLPTMGIIVLDYSRWQNPDDFFIFTILHEIGHCETYEPKQYKVKREFLATQWAIVEFNKLKLKLKKSEKKIWQEYIYSYTKAKDKSKYLLDWSAM